MQYGINVGDFSANQILTVGSVPDWLFITNLGYTPKIADWRFVGRAENVTRLSDAGHVSSAQRLRLGIGVESYEMGAAADLSEKSEKRKGDQLTYNLGGFVSVKF